MLYNENFTYNNANITYNGVLHINIPGISAPVILSNITVVFGGDIDYSNATTIGLITYDISSTGIITISATQDQAEAVSQSGIIYLVGESETSPVFSATGQAESGSATAYVNLAANVSIENLGS